MSAFFVLGFVVTVSSGQPLAAFMAVGFMVSVAFGRIIWLASHIVVSPRGVTTKGLLRRGWLAWPDIDHFESEELDASAMPSRSIVAKTVGGETVIVCTIPFQPILFDSLERHNRAVDRVLSRLEEEMEVLADRTPG